MASDHEAIEALRSALADAQQARDAAIAEAAATRQRWQDERRDERHRLRNMLAVIRAIARRTGDDAETVEDYCGILDGRLQSYLNVQAAVAQDWNKGADLALLLAGELLAFDLQEGERVEFHGPPVTMKSRAAGLLALAFHELASAAIMSGRLDETSQLHISWHLDGEALTLDWIEPAVAPAGAPETSSSWAEWVEQAIAHQLAGTMTTEMTAAGRSTRLILPATAMC